MVKSYTKNHEFWYKVYHISPNIQFYKNKTSSGCISGYTELGEHNKDFKRFWVQTGDSKHVGWPSGTHKSEREGEIALKVKERKVECTRSSNSELSWTHKHKHGSCKPSSYKIRIVQIDFKNTAQVTPSFWVRWVHIHHKANVRVAHVHQAHPDPN